MNSLKGKHILITGGTSALGRAFVLKALEARGHVYLTYHRDEKTAKELEQKGAKIFCLDLSDMRAIDTFVKNLKESTKVLDVLIHNAAAVRDHTIQNLTEEDWDMVLTVDLKAPYYLTKKSLSFLFKSANAKIFMLTSRVGIQGGYGVSNYAAAKAGMIGLTKSLAQELGKKNILVNAVNPGFMPSSMTKDLPDTVIQKNREANPLGKYSDPAQVADFLAYLSSDAMTQVTGQVLNFEGRKI